MKFNAGSLSDYLSATLKVTREHSDNQPQLMFMVEQMDEIFQTKYLAKSSKRIPLWDCS